LFKRINWAAIPDSENEMVEIAIRNKNV